MKRLLIVLLLVLGNSAAASAREAWHDWCQIGNQHVITSGLSSTTVVQKSAPSCVITVYVHGGGLATIYADNNNTPLANPFTSQSDGQIIWYADNGVYDQTTSSAGLPQTVTLSGILLCDPFAVGSTCNNGGATTAHNLLSTTHLDTIPASPPVRGDVITAQNQTSPTSVNPSWARLPLGTNGQVLTSNGIDAIWAPVASGGCTPSGAVDTGVISEHPVGQCFDSSHFTWNDGSNKQILRVGDGTNTATTTQNVFLIGEGNATTGSGLCCGDDVYMFGNSNVNSLGTSVFAFGISNTVTAGGDIYILGENNTSDHTGTNGNVIIGFNNNAKPVTPNTNTGIQHTFTIGQSNLIQTPTGSNGIKDSVVIGLSNQLTNTNTTGGGSRFLQDIFVAGEGNTLAQTNNNLIQSVHVMGSSNAIANTLNDTLEVEVVGESNQVDGALSTLQILGYANIVHNASPQRISTVDTTVVGAANTVTNTGVTGTPAYQGVFGGTDTLSNCTGCWIVGQGVTNSSNQTLAIGMSTVPEMAITSGHNAITGHIDQSVTKNIAGTCTMSGGTTCTWTLTAAYSGTPICVVTVQSATLTGGVAGCTVSGTTVTITAATNNSLAWGAFLVGNPN